MPHQNIVTLPEKITHILTYNNTISAALILKTIKTIQSSPTVCFSVRFIRGILFE